MLKICFGVFIALIVGASSQILAKPDVLPSISSVTQTGEKFELSMDMVEKPTLIAFWATWCDKCVYEIPHLNNVEREYSRNLDVLAVNIDSDFEYAKKFMKKYGVTYKNIKDADGAIADSFEVRFTPALFLVDTDGKIIKTARQVSELKSDFAKLIHEKSQVEKKVVEQNALFTKEAVK